MTFFFVLCYNIYSIARNTVFIMFTAKEKVLYASSGVCEITEITKKKFGAEEKDYYVLVPIYRNASTVFVPVDSEALCLKMRKLPDKRGIDKLFESAKDSLMPWEENKYLRHEKFMGIVEKGSESEIFALARLLFDKSQELLDKGKRLHITDERILDTARKLIDDTVAYVLDMPRDTVSEFISAKINGIK